MKREGILPFSYSIQSMKKIYICIPILTIFLIQCSSLEDRVAEAAYEGDLSYLKEKTDTTGHPNFQTEKGWTPLMTAAESGQIPTLEYLISLNAYLDLRNSSGDTALMRAVANNQSSAVDLLLKSGADKKLRNSKGYLPLHRAVENGNVEIAGKLIDLPSDLELPIYHLEKKCPIHILANSQKSMSFLKWMLEKKINLNTKDADGRTGLMVFIMNRKNDEAKLLIEQGASLREVSNYGETAFTLSQANGDKELIQLIQSRLK
ncbi:MAG: ankyrin repeat domain-containing protein [Leptospiraceae bacterium]|nr:ankyrin repeat domain-containing protein [Leptospiraceae bacterium]MCP5510369.1 ankyrin repeat domain-containing protein [Leptospiraceae bacterium]